MQDRIARALYVLSYERSDWATESEDLRGLYCRRALAAMKAMREPTPEMVAVGDRCELYAGGIWRAMLDAEISIAEGGKDGQ